jgi:hypothetical protein|tara:strand:+ start:3327 stop:5831 length:2505 start_codon:yes stop_codon:yes gene_type:complete
MSENTTKVVQLNSHLAAPGQVTDELQSLTRMPAAFVETKDKGKQALRPLLQALFDNIDDALFELADRAEHNAEQNMFFESMREVRIKRRGMELCFGQELDNRFRLLLTNDAPRAKSSADDPRLAVDSLSLIANEDLEELVAADTMIIKAEGEFTDSLSQLTTRIDTLVHPLEVTDKTNPFGPTSVCQSFVGVCKTLDMDIRAKLVLFKLFDRYVMTGLGDVYAACNEVLVNNGILPGLAKGRTAAARADSNIQQPPAAGGTVDVFAQLQTLLHGLPQHTAGIETSGLVAVGQAPQIPRDTLMTLLQSVQLSLAPQLDQQLQAALQGVGPQQLDIQQSLSNLLSAKLPSKPMSIGQVESDALNLVAMLFQFILDDRNLAAPMKALIARLQIPFIKAAMIDSSFFTKGGHPARRLLNEIASASLGWVATGIVDRDPLYAKVSSIVTRIQREFDGDSRLFQDVLTDFVAFLDMDKRRIGLVEQRTINAEDGKAKSEQARTAVQTALNERVAGLSLPKVVISLLEQAWSNVLFLIYLKEGDQAENWQEGLNVVDDLLWSVQPMDSADSRHRLVTMVPPLLKNVRAGLTKIGYNPFEMSQLFTDLEVVHLSQLQALNTVKLDMTASTVSTEQNKDQRSIARETSVIEKTLDQLLEGHGGSDVSLEELDAELDEQLAAFDALGDLMAGDSEIAPLIDTAALEVLDDLAVDLPAENSPLARQVVEKLVVDGAAEEPAGGNVDLPDDDPSSVIVDSMVVGHWIELHQDNKKKFRCRLAAVIRATGKYIFVNRSGMKVAEYSRLTLAQAIQRGQVGTLDDGQLFDRALESVIGSLRDMKTTTA